MQTSVVNEREKIVGNSPGPEKGGIRALVSSSEANEEKSTESNRDMRLVNSHRTWLTRSRNRWLAEWEARDEVQGRRRERQRSQTRLPGRRRQEIPARTQRAQGSLETIEAAEELDRVEGILAKLPTRWTEGGKTPQRQEEQSLISSGRRSGGGTVREPAETHTPITKHQRSAHDQQSDKVAYYTIILDPIE